MIPKIIHYCWFGRGKKPHLIRKCIKSWRRVMPDYEIKEWNEDNFDINCIPFVKQAYEEKKWAFVADVCRFHACYTEGGIYLDTDVEVFRRFDEFLNDHFFIGTQVQAHPDREDWISIDSSVFGCEKGNQYALECMNFYHDKTFRNDKGQITGGTVQAVAGKILSSFGYKYENRRHFIDALGGVNIYPTSYFTNITDFKARNRNKSDIYALHYFDGSWNDESRGKFYHFCKRHDCLHLYRFLENFKFRWIKIFH